MLEVSSQGAGSCPQVPSSGGQFSRPGSWDLTPKAYTWCHLSYRKQAWPGVGQGPRGDWGRAPNFHLQGSDATRGSIAATTPPAKAWGSGCRVRGPSSQPTPSTAGLSPVGKGLLRATGPTDPQRVSAHGVSTWLALPLPPCVPCPSSPGLSGTCGAGASHTAVHPGHTGS